MDKSFLFCRITKLKSGERLREGAALSYTRLQKCLKEKLIQLGFPASQFGLHSLRAGGTTAAANSKIPDRLFRRHDRWKSEVAKDGYIEDSLEVRLSVSRGCHEFWCCLIYCYFMLNFSLCHPRYHYSLNFLVCQWEATPTRGCCSKSWEVYFLPFEIRQKISSQQLWL